MLCIINFFSQVYHIIRPSRAPGFAYSWLELISHRVFIAKLLLQTPQQKVIQYTMVQIPPYSRKYWWKLDLTVEPKIAIARILVDLNLTVRYGIAMRIYVSRKFWLIF